MATVFTSIYDPVMEETVKPVRSRVRVAGMVLGVGLMIGAIVVAVRHADWAALRDASPWWVCWLMLAIVLNLIVSSVLHWIVTRPFDAAPPVTPGGMFKLIAVSALLNYLPLRAGLVGRAAYLKLRHGLPLGQSFLITVIITVLGVFLSGATMAMVVWFPLAWPLAGLMTVVLLCTLSVSAVKRLLKRRVVGVWAWPALRALILLIVAVRLYVAFAIVGHPVSFAQALLAAAAGLLANLIGVTPNGLGLREWFIAAVSPLSAAGLQAALIDRAVEAVVLVPVGIWAAQRLRRVEVVDESHDRQG